MALWYIALRMNFCRRRDICRKKKNKYSFMYKQSLNLYILLLLMNIIWTPSSCKSIFDGKYIIQTPHNISYKRFSVHLSIKFAPQTLELYPSI